MNELLHFIRGGTAVKIAASIEKAIRSKKLRSGRRLPPVRGLAQQLGVAPATVAAAYQSLQSRGLVICQGRRGTKVSYRPLACARAPVFVPHDVRNLYDGNPDPALLPPMGSALRQIDDSPHLYGQAPQDPGLLKLLRRYLTQQGIAGQHIALVNGAMDGIERVLAEALRPGDRVAVEDPSFGNVLDLVMSRGLSLVPVAVDPEGLQPDGLEQACAERIKAVILTPRVQNPTGAVITPRRAKALRAILRKHPDVLVVQDDHAGLITDAPLQCVHAGSNRWVYLRSFSKALNPDLRLAMLTGDSDTLMRVQDRMVVGERWVSHILQRLACALLTDAKVRKGLQRATRTYCRRREALLDALQAEGISALAPSGYNVWIQVTEETCTVQALHRRGWGVSPGERFRIDSPPAIRVTVATLQPDESRRFAADLAAVTRRSAETSMA